MAKENAIRTKEFDELIFTWRIENIRMCVQRNGEDLSSPTFTVDWLNESSWNLCLYPHGIEGEDDYMSYFIAQENKNVSMNNTGAKFELCLLAADGSKVQSEISECFWSMNKNGMFGWSRFISWKTLKKEKLNYLPDGTLTLCCRVRCEHKVDTNEDKKPVKLKAFARTRIRKEEIFQEMKLDTSNSHLQKCGDMKTILNTSPIVQLLVTCGPIFLPKNLAIDIEVEKNEKIKSAILKLVLVDRSKKVYWKTKYVWKGTIKCENIVLSCQLPKTSEQYVPKEMFDQKFLYFLCHFIFATGSATQQIEKNDYGNNLDRLFAQRLSDSTDIKEESDCQTAADALKSLFEDPIFHDVVIKGKNEEFKVHEMIMASRSEFLKKLLNERDKTTNIVQINSDDDDTLQRIIYFLYTDTILDMHWDIAKKMYKSATKYKIELLREKCIEYMKRNLSVSNVCEVLILIKNEKEPELKRYLRDFIIENHSAVFSSVEWSIFAKSNPTFAVEQMMIKYKLK